MTTEESTTVITQAFGVDADLYKDVLGISDNRKDVTLARLRKAYYKRALVYHPDKVSKGATAKEKQDATRKFQAISMAYTILSNPETRRAYDEDGLVQDDNDNMDGGWKDFFKSMFGQVTTKDIDAFAQNYKCSEEEEKDVVKYYKKFKGDLNKMLECVMLSTDLDKQRWFKDYLEPAIEAGTIPDYRKTLEETMQSEEDEDTADTEPEDESPPPRKKQKQAKKPTRKRRKKNDAEPDDDLIAMIRNNGKARGGGGGFNASRFISGLAEKYGDADSKLPSEDEFKKTRDRLDAQRKKKGKRGGK
eukprot:CAMPEP_0118680432 /NCGR_PEP_ID=MMETSP0800-20121206/4362_1 /TAXON_ID=210618 ORGANISM="Striatella unipunctata, Strain CCMP2910" /NCGR_SAMPLE_ID=MMETSP0800 /ASSEMBLY_ACC=CAM_ASM_000638 /LENGTH=303 /DNA_ID=CAMNT_0006576581 /DNA_START=13 /DNA_END=924 /DNA_ORIENTATION=-